MNVISLKPAFPSKIFFSSSLSQFRKAQPHIIQLKLSSWVNSIPPQPNVIPCTLSSVLHIKNQTAKCADSDPMYVKRSSCRSGALLAIETKLIHGSLTNNSTLCSFLPSFLRTMQELIPTIQTKQVQTKCLFIIKVLNASSTMEATCYAYCATPTQLRSLMFRLTTLGGAIINRSQFLASWTHLYVNCTVILTCDMWILSVELWLLVLLLQILACIQ